MLIVFVDTVAWIALVNTRDSLHGTAKKVFAEFRAQSCMLLTSEFILLEFANGLSAPIFREKAAIFIQGLREMPEVEIIPASSSLFTLGLELYQNRSDKEWSLVDCASFIVMEENKITKAFTSDHHFVQAGFEVLL